MFWFNALISLGLAENLSTLTAVVSCFLVIILSASVSRVSTKVFYACFEVLF